MASNDDANAGLGAWTAPAAAPLLVAALHDAPVTGTAKGAAGWTHGDSLGSARSRGSSLSRVKAILMTPRDEFARMYVRRLHAARWAVLGVYAVLLGVCAWAAPQLLFVTKPSYEPPPGSIAYEQNALVAQPHVFPAFAQRTDLVLFVEAVQPGQRVDEMPALDTFMHALNSSITARYGIGRGRMVSVLQGYYLLRDQGMPSLVTDKFLSGPNASSTIIVVQVETSRLSQAAIQFADWLTTQTSALTPPNAPFQVTITGVPAFVKATADSIERDMSTIDVIVMPCAMLILCAMLRTWRLLVIPLATMAMSALVAFAIMRAVATTVTVFVTVPAVMMSLIVAFSIDFALFMLTRYRAELLETRGQHRLSVERMIQFAGHTISVSGGTMALCFVGMTIGFDVAALRTLGLGCCVSILATLVVNLTLAPALLLAFPRFFRRSAQGCLCWARKVALRRGTDGLGGGGARGGEAGSPGRRSRGLTDTTMSSFGAGASDAEGYGSMSDASHAEAAALGGVYGAASAGGRLPSRDGLSAALLDKHRASLAAVASTGVGIGIASSAAGDTGGPHVGGPGGGVGGGTGGDYDGSPNQATLPPPEYHSDASLRHLGQRTSESPHTRERRMRASLWYRSAALFTRWPWNLLVLAAVVGATYPITRESTHMVFSDTLQMEMPRGYPATDGYERMMDAFGPGALYPYNIVVWLEDAQPNAGGITGSAAVLNETVFAAVQEGIAEWAATLPFTEANDFRGLPWAFGTNYTAAFVSQANAMGALPAAPPIFRFVHYAYAQLVNAGGTATVVEFTPRFNAVATVGETWLREMRAHLSAFEARNPGIRALLVGQAADSVDIMATVYRVFPLVIGLTCGAVVLLLGFFFRSVFVALQAVVTIAITICFCFGLVKLVYIDGVFDGLGLPGLARSPDRAINWIPPVSSFVIIAGLGVDYQSFLLVAIVEARREGRSTSDAIATASYRAGTIITTCGAIMAVAFSGLLVGEIPALNVFGALLCFSVVFDTLVVRTVLVPALMGIVGDLNWWPVPSWSAPGGGKPRRAVTHRGDVSMAVTGGKGGGPGEADLPDGDAARRAPAHGAGALWLSSGADFASSAFAQGRTEAAPRPSSRGARSEGGEARHLRGGSAVAPADAPSSESDTGNSTRSARPLVSAGAVGQRAGAHVVDGTPTSTGGPASAAAVIQARPVAITGGQAPAGVGAPARGSVATAGSMYGRLTGSLTELDATDDRSMPSGPSTYSMGGDGPHRAWTGASAATSSTAGAPRPR